MYVFLSSKMCHVKVPRIGAAANHGVGGLCLWKGGKIGRARDAAMSKVLQSLKKVASGQFCAPIRAQVGQ